MECDYVTPSYFREMEKEFQQGRLEVRGGGVGGSSAGRHAAARSAARAAQQRLPSPAPPPVGLAPRLRRGPPRAQGPTSVWTSWRQGA